MGPLDLAEIRAQLRAQHQERPPAPKGPIRALRRLLAPYEPASLFSSPPSYMEQRRPPAVSQPPSPIGSDTEDEEPLVLDLRRPAFGQRNELSLTTPLALPAPADAPTAIYSHDVEEAIRRLRSVRSMVRPAELDEIPFLPEDLADDGEAVVLELAKAPPPSRAEAMLIELEERLLAEQMTVVRALARA